MSPWQALFSQFLGSASMIFFSLFLSLLPLLVLSFLAFLVLSCFSCFLAFLVFLSFPSSFFRFLVFSFLYLLFFSFMFLFWQLTSSVARMRSDMYYVQYKHDSLSLVARGTVGFSRRE